MLPLELFTKWLSQSHLYFQPFYPMLSSSLCLPEAQLVSEDSASMQTIRMQGAISHIPWGLESGASLQSSSHLPSFQTFTLQPLCKVPVPLRLMPPGYATSFPLYYCCPPISSSLLLFTKVWAPGFQIFMFNTEKVSDAFRIDYVPY